MCEHALRWALRQRPQDAPAAAVLHAIAFSMPAAQTTFVLCQATGLSRPATLAALRSLEDSNLVALRDGEAMLVGYLPAPKSARKPRTSTGLVTLATWLERITAAGERMIPAGDPLLDYADEIGLPQDMLNVHWHTFRRAYTEDAPKKLYTDWRATFRKSVRGNWFRLWFIDGADGPKWTTVGQQALASYKAARAREARPS